MLHGLHAHLFALWRRAALGVAALAPIASAQGGAGSGVDSVLLEPVVVTAPRSTQPATSSRAGVTVVDAEDLARTGERSLPRALGRATGVWIQESNLGGGAPVIRGLLGNQILIVLDGVRLNDSTTRFGPNQILNTIDPAIVERIEVVRGSHSVLYGSDAIGGVILVWTKGRAPARGAGEAGAGGFVRGTFDSATEGGRGAGGVSGATADLGWLGVFGGERWQDLRAGDGEVQRETGYHGHSVFGAVDFALGASESLRVSTMFNRTFDVPRTFQVVAGFGQTEPSFARYDFALQDREHAQLTYANDALGWADRLQVRLFARRYTEQRSRRRTGSNVDVFGETEVASLGVGVDVVSETGAGHRWTFGLDAIHDDVDSFRVDTDLATGARTERSGDFAPGARYGTYGVFVQDEIETGSPWLLTLGLRGSWFDFAFDDAAGARETGDFGALTASVAAARELTEGTKLTTTLAQGFQAPNLEDLANEGRFAGGTELANPDLDPARSLMAEVALDVQRRRWSGTAALFWTRIDDYLGRRLLDVGDPGTAGDELYQRTNAGEVQLFGAELGAQWILGGLASPWSLEARASWVRGRQTDRTRDPNTGERPLDGVEVRRIPPLNGQLGLLWENWGDADRFGVDSARLSVLWANEQDQLHPEDVGDPRIDPRGTPGWAIWNLDLDGPVARGVRWNLSLVNLLDQNYRAHGSAIDGPGRSVVVGFEATF